MYSSHHTRHILLLIPYCSHCTTHAVLPMPNCPYVLITLFCSYCTSYTLLFTMYYSNCITLLIILYSSHRTVKTKLFTLYCCTDGTAHCKCILYFHPRDEQCQSIIQSNLFKSPWAANLEFEGMRYLLKPA